MLPMVYIQHQHIIHQSALVPLLFRAKPSISLATPYQNQSQFGDRSICVTKRKMRGASGGGKNKRASCKTQADTMLKMQYTQPLESNI